MKDYAVHLTTRQNMIIDYVKAATERKALNLARKIFGPNVTVSPV